MSMLRVINPKEETEKIIDFLQKTFAEHKIKKAVIGVSGGIDSAVSSSLLSLTFPAENIIKVHLPFVKKDKQDKKSLLTIPINSIVEEIARVQKIEMQSKDPEAKIRLGNIMARVRMTILFDLAKKNNALVCGTENKTENLLGYFTRFGDAASDIEPIAHLYKTEVKEIAKFLGIPDVIINQAPSANLWEGQTDEGEFGFTYEEADQVLYLFFEKNVEMQKIISLGFKNAEKVILRAKSNSFKHKTPYELAPFFV